MGCIKAEPLSLFEKSFELNKSHPLFEAHLKLRKCPDLDGLDVPCITCMPGGGIVGDSGLCCCVPVFCVTSVERY